MQKFYKLLFLLLFSLMISQNSMASTVDNSKTPAVLGIINNFILTPTKALSIREMLAGQTVYEATLYGFSSMDESEIYTKSFNPEMTEMTLENGSTEILFSNDTITTVYSANYSTTYSLILNGKYIDSYYDNDFSKRYYATKADAIEDFAQQVVTLKTLLIGETLYYREYDSITSAYVMAEHTFIESEILAEMFPFNDYSKAQSVIYYGNGSTKIGYYFNQADVPL